MTREGCRACPLPPARVLQERVALFLALVTSPAATGGRGAGHEAAARRLAAELLEPCREELAGATGVLVAADGILNRVPFEMLPLPGDPDGLAPTARAMARVPSAGVLLSVRGAPGPGGRGIALLADANSGADRLPGAEREARRLERDYREVRRLGRLGPAEAGGPLAAAAGAAILHVPAHSEADDQRPWNSRLRAGADSAGEPRWLTSAEIAAAPLGVPLAVLSGCSSAAGQAVAGEGMLGLSGAFLAAGSRAVVATLWDVDDATAARFMAAFYRELAAGVPVGAALAAARRDLAAHPETAAPRHWAAFVVVGDGSLVVPVARRPAPPAMVAGAVLLGVAAAAAALAATARRREAVVISGPGEALP